MESLTHSEDGTIICGHLTSSAIFFYEILSKVKQWSQVANFVWHSRQSVSKLISQEYSGVSTSKVVHALVTPSWCSAKNFCDLWSPKVLQFAKLDHLSVSFWHINSKTGRWLRYSIVRTCKSGDHWPLHCCLQLYLILLPYIIIASFMSSVVLLFFSIFSQFFADVLDVSLL